MALYDNENKLWRSPNSIPLSNDEISPGQRILDAISAHGSKIAQINDETGFQMTYHDIRTESVHAAQNLLKRGIRPRDVFGFLADHSDHLVSIMLASMYMACPMATLHPMLSKEEIVRFFRKAKPSVVFCDISGCEQLSEALKQLPFSVKVFTFGGQVDGFEPVENLFVGTGEGHRFVPTVVDNECDIGIIACSSGTTGPSKCLSLNYDVPLFTRPNLFDSSNIFYCADAIFWTIGIKEILDCIHSGATRIISTKSFTPEIPLELIEKYRVTVLPIAAFDLIACLKTDFIRSVDLSSVREIFVYGGHVPTNLTNQVHRYFSNASVTIWYGLTEIGMISSYDPKEYKDGGGIFTDGYTIKIVDENGNRCGPNVMGELCVKKEHTFQSYLDDPVATATALDEEGFFQTGDIVYIDDNGRLFIKDRKKNVLTLFYFDSILVPFELEECLIDMPGVKEVCVVGVPIAGGATLPAAVIVRKSNSILSKRDVFDKIEDHFPKRSRLRAGVYFVDALPKTGNGKLVRREITKMATEMFTIAKQCDSDIRSYLLDIPYEFSRLI